MLIDHDDVIVTSLGSHPIFYDVIFDDFYFSSDLAENLHGGSFKVLSSNFCLTNRLNLVLTQKNQVICTFSCIFGQSTTRQLGYHGNKERSIFNFFFNVYRYTGKVTKFQGKSFCRFRAVSLLKISGWKPPSAYRVKVIGRS